VDSSIRASAFAGLGAFALSIIVAMFSRVPLGALLVRALLSGIGFAGLIFGAQWILRRFLPELFDDPARSPAPSTDALSGTMVDIVLPGGEEERLEPSSSAAGPRPGDAEAPRLDAIGAEPRPTVDSGDLQREVDDLRSDALIASDPMEAVRSGSVAPRPSIALDELDTLPDLDGFSDSFTEGQPGEIDTSGSPGGGSSRFAGVSDTMPTAGDPDPGRDPVVLAKAVQTLLRRDQKGQ